MNLKFIKTDKCPVCGCGIVKLEYIEPDCDNKSLRTHAYGGQWEHRPFLCGKEIVYIQGNNQETTQDYEIKPITVAGLK